MSRSLDPALEAFIASCRARAGDCGTPTQCVTAIAPLMLDLISGGRDFLKPEHRRSDPDHYARNAIFIDEEGGMSLFALVWSPGQWTPVHDHGTWGVVGVVAGVLEEQAYMSATGTIDSDGGIDLRPGGLVLLSPGAVTTFVPNPDHIHMTGVAIDRPPVVSLHLYGRALRDFHVYDIAAGTRQAVEVTHYES